MVSIRRDKKVEKNDQQHQTQAIIECHLSFLITRQLSRLLVRQFPLNKF